jgi:phosphoribosylaminoimidazolecarboxamide formyltransferase/IMP cyclohydrolase
LLSVSDKRGIVAFAQALAALGWEIVSTGGTADALRRAGVAVIPIDDVTGFPEIMDGRVKTLHPKVHGGLLARRAHPGDRAALTQHGITPIDLVAVNLYPFRETVAKPDTTFEQAIEQIDIGGPSMLRSAAKNHHDVIVIVEPDDYPVIVAGLTPGASPGITPDLRRALATKVFSHTAAYDAAILNYLTRDADQLPPALALVLTQQRSLRYEGTPTSARRSTRSDEPGVRDLRPPRQVSFSNLLDLDAALLAAAAMDRPPGVRDHQAPPRRAASRFGRSPKDAYERALAADRTSAFGSVIAFNVAVDRATAEAMRDLFVEGSRRAAVRRRRARHVPGGRRTSGS